MVLMVSRYSYEEFHPMLFCQHEAKPRVEFDTFNQAVDNFFSNIGSQKLDMKQLQQVCIDVVCLYEICNMALFE